MSEDEKPQETSAAMTDAVWLLTDEQLEAELTIAVANAGLAKRYEMLLAERERRRAG